jgi:membrane carboxypeptidase/penicillin-binding protein
MDPQTGNLLALVGGSDYGVTPFNRALRSRRQPGSAFKPFVYAAALEHGLSPVSTIGGLRGAAVQVPDGMWIPREGRENEQDSMTLRDALAESSNAAAVMLQQQVGRAPVLRLANDLGVRNQPDVPSLALGSGLVTPLDLTAAYAAFPSLGFRVRPRGIVSVVDASGRAVHQVHIEREQILSPQVAFQMLTMLQDVVNRGTGSGVRTLGVRGAIGGKTGTTNDYHDAWSRMALPIWADFMRRTAQLLPTVNFIPPADLRTEELCLISHLHPVEGCPTYVEYFKDGDDVPARLCDVHTGNLKQRARRAFDGFLRALGRELTEIFR